MVIYDKVKRFNSVTGKPVEAWIEKEIRCDYTGELVDYDNSYCVYHLDYNDQDPCFGSGGDEFKFGKDFEVEMHSFLSGTYHFKAEDGGFAERDMFEEVLKNCDKKKSEWHRCYTFDAICRYARIRTARRLIEKKIIKPEQLKGDK